jgi:Predicted amidohydrolase
MSFLKLALIHSAAEHKQTARNRDRLLDLFRQAGEAGAQLVVAPEMAVSGYSFDNRQDIAPYTETASRSNRDRFG